MKKQLPIFAVILAMLLWGTSFFFSKVVVDANVGPGLLIAIRAPIACLFLLPFCIKRFKKMTKKLLILNIVTGIIMSVAYICQASSVKYCSSGMASFLENSYMLVVPFLTWAFTKKRPTVVSFICVGLSIVGLVLLSVANGDFNDPGSIAGIVLGICGGLLFGVNICLTGCFEKDKDPLVYTFIQFAIVSVVALIYTLIFERNFPSMDLKTWGCIIYLGIFGVGVAWLCRNYAQNKISPISIAIVLPFTSVVAIILSIVFEKASFNALSIVGCVIIFLAVVLDGVFASLIMRKKEKQQ